MTAPTGEIPADLECHGCGYDLRAQPQDGKCPECGMPVEESRRWATIPRRPAWQDSDSRWRRRVLAGAWLLVLLPLVDLLRAVGWAASVPAPNVFGPRAAGRTLGETLLCDMGVYQPLIFCMGVVLLFARERGRRRNRLDWTRRWGVICSYVVLLLSATQILFLAMLVLVGISALCLSMPLNNQPRVTQVLVNVSTAYLRYGPHPMDDAAVVRAGFSSAAILLACIPLFDALRSSGPKRLAAILLAPLALFALINLVQAGRYWSGVWSVPPSVAARHGLYFAPELVVGRIAGLPPGWGVAPGSLAAVCVEVAKWSVVLVIAVWLSVARLAAGRECGKFGGVTS